MKTQSENTMDGRTFQTEAALSLFHHIIKLFNLDDECEAAFDLEDTPKGTAMVETYYSDDSVKHRIRLNIKLLTDPATRKKECMADRAIYAMWIPEKDAALLSFLHELGHVVCRHDLTEDSEIYDAAGHLTEVGESYEEVAYFFARCVYVGYLAGLHEARSSR